MRIPSLHPLETGNETHRRFRQKQYARVDVFLSRQQCAAIDRIAAEISDRLAEGKEYPIPSKRPFVARRQVICAIIDHYAASIGLDYAGLLAAYHNDIGQASHVEPQETQAAAAGEDSAAGSGDRPAGAA